MPPFLFSLPRAKAVGVAQASGRSFRPDIEGLRAVAVVIVILYHLKVSALPGGFIGVDIFFVISGYLMAAIILSDVALGRFQMRRFLTRRVLRIWPALCVLLLSVLIAGIFMLPPEQLAELGNEVLSTFLLANNVTLWAQTGYFAPAAETTPLLHLWSIAVEQQFYLLVPLLILAAFAKPGSDRRWLIFGVGIASFILSAVLTSPRPVFSFYLLPTRVWEFLLGSLLALYDVKPMGRSMSESLSGVGVILIVLSAQYLNGASRFPGYIALLPCLGAAFLICGNAGAPTVTGRVLGSAPFVAIGTLSYSLYLWHWPIIVFFRPRGAAIETLEMRALIVTAALVCAYLSWRCVETPFRKLASVPYATMRKSGFGIAALTAALIGTLAVATEGLPFRIDGATLTLLAYQKYPQRAALYREGECFLRIDQPAAEFHADTCSDWTPGAVKLLLWGDSHAAHYAFGLREGGRKSGLGFLQATYAGCAPVPRRAGLSPSCAAFGNDVSALAMSPDVDATIISANWTGYGGILPELRAMVQSLASAGRFVIVLGPSIEFDGALPVLLTGRRFGAAARRMQTRIAERAIQIDARMAEEFSGMVNVLYVSPIEETCPQFVCPVELPSGVPLTWDSTHLTAEGSLLVSSLLLKKIVPAVRNFVSCTERPVMERRKVQGDLR